MSIPILVLDHGYVKHVESWGHGLYSEIHGGSHDQEIRQDPEAGIIEAARQSTQGSFRGWEDDAKLLKYLWEHDHMTPFEFAGMTIEVQLPLFVRSEWHRHRTQSYNEASARYAPLPDLYYIPDLERVMQNGGHLSKQAQGAGNTLTRDKAEVWLNHLKDVYDEAEDDYQATLADGVPKELARLVMPVGHYTKMRASANLRNWFQFLTLRLAPNAQWEIREYASAVLTILEDQFPRTTRLFKGEFE